MRVSLMQFITDLTPPPQDVAAWAEEREFAGLYAPEKTHVPTSRRTPWPGGELPNWYRRCYDPFVALSAAAVAPTVLFGCRASARAFDVIARHGNGWQPIEGYGELLPALPRLYEAFERSGRDPSTAQVCVYSSAGDRRVLDEYEKAGVAEVALTVPSAGRDEVLAALDRLAPLVAVYAEQATSHA